MSSRSGFREPQGLTDKRWALLGGDIKLNRGAVKKLSELEDKKELKSQITHLLTEGRLPRAKQSRPAKATPKTQAASLVERLKAKDEKQALAIVKEMARLVGLKVTEAKARAQAK